MSCSANGKCLHCRRENIIGTGSLSEHFPEPFRACGDPCFVCNESYRKYFLPINHSGAIQFLKSKRFNDSLNTPIIHAESDWFLNLLHTSEKCLGWVFGRRTVKKYNTSCFFFQLFATGIL